MAQKSDDMVELNALEILDVFWKRKFFILGFSIVTTLLVAMVNIQKAQDNYKSSFYYHFEDIHWNEVQLVAQNINTAYLKQANLPEFENFKSIEFTTMPMIRENKIDGYKVLKADVLWAKKPADREKAKKVFYNQLFKPFLNKVFLQKTHVLFTNDINLSINRMDLLMSRGDLFQQTGLSLSQSLRKETINEISKKGTYDGKPGSYKGWYFDLFVELDEITQNHLSPSAQSDWFKNYKKILDMRKETRVDMLKQLEQLNVSDFSNVQDVVADLKQKVKAPSEIMKSEKQYLLDYYSFYHNRLMTSVRPYIDEFKTIPASKGRKRILLAFIAALFASTLGAALLEIIRIRNKA